MIELIRVNEVTDNQLCWWFDCKFRDEDGKTSMTIIVYKHEDGTWSAEDEDRTTISGDNLDQLQYYRWNVEIISEIVNICINMVKNKKKVWDDHLTNLDIFAIETDLVPANHKHHYISYVYSFNGEEIEMREPIEYQGKIWSEEERNNYMYANMVVDGNNLPTDPDQDYIHDKYDEFFDYLNINWENREEYANNLTINKNIKDMIDKGMDPKDANVLRDLRMFEGRMLSFNEWKLNESNRLD